MKIDPIELTVEIERDPADVFEFIRDYSNEPEWQTGAIEVRTDPPGPAEAGTVIHQKRKTPMGTQSFTMEVLSVDPEARTIASVARDGMFAGTSAEYAIDGGEGFSRLHVRMVPDLNGMAATLAKAGFIRGRIGRSLSDDWSKDLASLAALLKQV